MPLMTPLFAVFLVLVLLTSTTGQAQQTGVGLVAILRRKADRSYVDRGPGHRDCIRAGEAQGRVQVDVVCLTAAVDDDARIEPSIDGRDVDNVIL